MAKKSAGFVHEHIEKVAIALGAAFLVAAIYIGFASGRFNVNGDSPSDLINKVSSAADQTITRFQNPPPVNEDTGASKNEEAVDKLLAWYGPNAKSLAENAGVNMDVERAREFPPLFISTTEVPEEDKHNLARLVEPDLPIVASGRSTLQFPVETPPIEEYEPDGRDETESKTTNWVAVASQVDLKEQDFYFRSEKYPPGSYLNIVKVHLQRRDRNEMWRGWQTVDTWLPFEPIERPPASQPKKLRDKIDAYQSLIARPRLPERADGDRIEYDKLLPLLSETPKRGDNFERRAKDWLDRAEKAKNDRDAERVLVFARAAMTVRNAPSKVVGDARNLYKQALRRLKKRSGGYEERPKSEPGRMMPIIAYDLTAMPGHEYQYRIRYEVLNQFAGNDAELKDPSGASEITLFSAWSPATPPVRVDADVQFYLTDANQDAKMVEVTVWKRKGRSWDKQDFRLGVGEEIGKKGKSGTDFATGAIVVDLRFNESINGRQEAVMVYATPDGTLHEAILSVDKSLNDEQKKREKRA